MSKHHQAIKDTAEWKAARRACLERDGYACIQCRAVEELEVDHIIELSVAPELAFDLENLRTLCKPCHTLRTTETRTSIQRQAWVNPRYSLALADVLARLVERADPISSTQFGIENNSTTESQVTSDVNLNSTPVIL